MFGSITSNTLEDPIVMLSTVFSESISPSLFLIKTAFAVKKINISEKKQTT